MFFFPNILVSRLTSYAEEIIRYRQCESHATGQLLIIYTAFIKYLRKMGIHGRSTSDNNRLEESL